ncbi:MAG: DUF1816 domain-containing protein [Microcystis aeruginosa Ma_AC_P_19900807_S299]|nr:MAG: DUF1816 domain-containing protein [Microcystis aeruginosa Ma_AC_P_19900807_S299]
MLEANNQGENQIFLYEVVFSGSSGSLPQRFSRTVPKSRMSQETQRLLRQGAKILSIRPLDPETAPIKPSLPPQPWWIEITTTQPKCLYYFGPFESFSEALSHQSGYIEDLQSESALGINSEIKQCQPEVLTQEYF